MIYTHTQRWISIDEAQRILTRPIGPHAFDLCPLSPPKIKNVYTSAHFHVYENASPK